MKKYGIVLLFCGCCFSAIAQSFFASKQIDIDDYLKNKKPLFLTGTSLSPAEFNVYPMQMEYYLGEDNLDRSHGPSLQAYSSVSMLIGDEVFLPPLNFVASLFPIAKDADGNIVCVKTPKLGAGYYEVKNYDKYELFILNFTNAFANNEVSASPKEMDPMVMSDYLKFYGMLPNSNQLTVRCLLERLTAKYKWVDEFQKREYMNGFVTKYNASNPSSVFKQPTLTSQSSATSPLYFVDYVVEFGEYNFENHAYPVTFTTLLNGSVSFNNFPFKLSFNIRDQSFEPNLKAIDFNSSKNEIRINKLALDSEEKRRQERSYHNRVDFNLPADEVKARTIANSFISDRSMILRVNLRPAHKNDTAGSCNCDNILQ